MTIREQPSWVAATSATIRRLPFGRYRSLKFLSARSRQPFLSRLPMDVGGAKYIADLRDSISAEVCFTGKYEPQETMLIRSLLCSGNCFVDVGANWGYFTLIASSIVQACGKVVSLEPDSRLHKRLIENIDLNGITNVTALPIAAAHIAGKFAMKGYNEIEGNSGLSRLASEHDAEGSTFMVDTDRLDKIIETYCPDGVDLLKMDIEGAEDLALLGLTSSLARGACRRILLELHPTILQEKGCTVRLAIQPLLQSRYRLFRIDHSAKATRSTAYSSVKPSAVQSLLSPLESTASLDSWPHILCLAPGVSC